MAADTPRCVACREPISNGAELCTKCGSAQNWTRHLLRHAALASATLALVPAFTIAASLYEIAFGRKEAIINAQILNCTAEQIDISLTNTGDTAGVVRNVIFSSSGAQPNDVTVQRKPPSKAEYFVSEVGSSAVLSYEPFVGGVKNKFPRGSGNGIGEECVYRLTMSYLSVAGSDKVEELSCACAG